MSEGLNGADPSGVKRERGSDSPDRKTRSPSPAGSDPWDVMSDDGTDMEDSPTSPSTTADLKVGKKAKQEVKPQIVSHLPTGHDEAMKTFKEVPGNVYFSSKIGRSRGQEDGMMCDCHYDPRKESLSSALACGEDANCINRLTQIECLVQDCRCREYCQNQRFQRRQYADMDIIKTDQKGFGLRARRDMTPDTFIYEYIGEVVPQMEFLRRMEKYKDQGIRHFYFMALAREEYVDATKVGGKARFINHSCNPNCYVAKWHVGKHMRMGIFAKRDIIAGEELTFNYNVDRYGNDAQTCHCNEPNCVGTIGGKTQTDVAGMDDLFIDALGITDEVELAEARGSKKKKSKQLGVDFTPTLGPVEANEVARVVNATRQASSNPRILPMLLQRIQLTSDLGVNRAFVQMHGIVLMSGLLDEWQDNKEVVMLTLSSLIKWPLITRNKIEDTGIVDQIRDLKLSKEPDVAELANALDGVWDSLEVSYRIARRGSDTANKENTSSQPVAYRRRGHEDEVGYTTFSAVNGHSNQPRAAIPSSMSVKTATEIWRERTRLDPGAGISPNTPPTPASEEDHRLMPGRSLPRGPSLEDIISSANRKAEMQRAQQEAAAKAQATAIAAAEKVMQRQAKSLPTDADRPRKRRRREHKSSSSSKTPERRLYKLIGQLVVREMSKSRKYFEKDSFKRHAKELTELIYSKELKNGKDWPPKDGATVSLPEEKQHKMKKFARDFVGKLVARKKEKLGRGTAPSTEPSTASEV